MVLYLILHILHGKGLAPKDSTGFSDPYCVVRFRGKPVLKTGICYKTLDPQWNEEVDLNQFAPTDVIEVECWDWDRISSADFEGQFTIPLYELREPTEVVKTFRLLGRGKKKDGEITGEITVKLQVIDVIRSQDLKNIDTKVFGVPLSTVMARQKSKSTESLEIPEFIRDILIALRADKETWTEDGMFRKAGSKSVTDGIREKIDKNGKVDFATVSRDDNGDIIKSFLRQLPEPMCCRALTPEWTSLPTLPTQDVVPALKKLLFGASNDAGEAMDRESQFLLAALMIFARDLCAVPATRMSSQSIGTCLAPNLFPKVELANLQSGLDTPINAVSLMVQHCDELFGDFVAPLGACAGNQSDTCHQDPPPVPVRDDLPILPTRKTENLLQKRNTSPLLSRNPDHVPKPTLPTRNSALPPPVPERDDRPPLPARTQK